MLFEEGIYPPKLTLMERTSMTLGDVDYLYKNDRDRFREYYYFVVEKLKAEQEEIDKAKDKISGGSGESDTFKFRGETFPEEFTSEVEEMK